MQQARRWREVRAWEFWCGRCQQWLPEGNPAQCPHQQGEKALREEVGVGLNRGNVEFKMGKA